jgi:hypothetical protein
MQFGCSGFCRQIAEKPRPDANAPNGPQQGCGLRLTARVATARCLSAVQPGIGDARAEGGFDGKIKAPLRGVESAVVSLCAHSSQHGTAQRPVVWLERERPESSMSRMALFAAWRTGSQNWDNPSHKRVEGRCRTSGATSRLAHRGHRRSRLTGLDGPPVARPLGFQALTASCERGAPPITSRSNPAARLSDGDRKAILVDQC